MDFTASRFIAPDKLCGNGNLGEDKGNMEINIFVFLLLFCFLCGFSVTITKTHNNELNNAPYGAITLFFIFF